MDEGVAPSIEFKEKMANDSGRHDILVHLIPDGLMGFGLKYLLVYADGVGPFLYSQFPEARGFESYQGRRLHHGLLLKGVHVFPSACADVVE